MFYFRCTFACRWLDNSNNRNRDQNLNSAWEYLNFSQRRKQFSNEDRVSQEYQIMHYKFIVGRTYACVEGKFNPFSKYLVAIIQLKNHRTEKPSSSYVKQIFAKWNTLSKHANLWKLCNKSNGTQCIQWGTQQGFWLTQNEHRNFRPVFESGATGRRKTFERENEGKGKEGGGREKEREEREEGGGKEGNARGASRF